MTKPTQEYSKRTFVEFVLEPLYKLCVNVITREKVELESILASLGVFLKKSDFKIDTKPLLKLVLRKYYGNCSSVIDCIVEYIPNAKIGTERKVDMYYQGAEKEKISECSNTGPLLINIIKLYNKPDCMSFDAFGRVISGTIHKN